MTTERSQERLKLIQNQEHPNCYICGSANQAGLRLTFRVCADGCVAAWFSCDPMFQGYAGFIHGGVISSLMDSAMANCLFAQGRSALTAELNVQFIQPVVTGRAALVKAWIKDSSPPLHLMEAEIAQNCKVVARATAKFMERE